MNSNKITLYGCPSDKLGSSSTWRVRAALDYKQLKYNEVSPYSVGDYKNEINPMGMIPAIKLPEFGDQVFCESLPILELLEETYPNAPKLGCPLGLFRYFLTCLWWRAETWLVFGECSERKIVKISNRI